MPAGAEILECVCSPKHALCREVGVRIYALLRGVYELIFTETAVAEDGTVVRQTVVRPARG